MKLIPLNCRNCGAPLEVPDDATYLTCGHCGTRLVVEGTGAAAHIELLDTLDERTGRIEEQVVALHRHGALAELDREWKLEKDGHYLSSTHQGSTTRYLPTRLHAWGRGLAALIPAAVMLAMFHDWIGRTDPFGIIAAALPAVIVASGIGMGLFTHRRAVAYELAEHRYRRRRAAVAAGEPDPGPAVDPAPAEPPPTPAANRTAAVPAALPILLGGWSAVAFTVCCGLVLAVLLTFRLADDWSRPGLYGVIPMLFPLGALALAAAGAVRGVILHRRGAVSPTRRPRRSRRVAGTAARAASTPGSDVARRGRRRPHG